MLFRAQLSSWSASWGATVGRTGNIWALLRQLWVKSQSAFAVALGDSLSALLWCHPLQPPGKFLWSWNFPSLLLALPWVFGVIFSKFSGLVWTDAQIGISKLLRGLQKHLKNALGSLMDSKLTKSNLSILLLRKVLLGRLQTGRKMWGTPRKSSQTFLGELLPLF